MVRTRPLESKKKTLSYQEADELHRVIYHWLYERLEQRYGKEYMLYMDESGIQSHAFYEYGWAPSGQRCQGVVQGQRGERFNIISAIRASNRQWLCPQIFQGTCTRERLEDWLHQLGKALAPPTNAPKRYVLILDNASFHKGGNLQKIAHQYHIRLVYLPPYSPDLNPIEQCWATLKHHVKRLLSQGGTILQALAQLLPIPVTTL